MISVELRFLARRYHGTPWGRHVNEGVPEWPPSPYRLLRALYDAWQRKCGHLAESDVREVLEKLASVPPGFHLPKAVSSHTRSYLSSNTDDPSDKSLIFDAFVAVPAGSACYIEWPLELTEQQNQTLSALLAALNYLGRSESWIEGRLAQPSEGVFYQCSPAHQHSQDNTEIVGVACTIAPHEYAGKGKWLDALTDSTTRILKEKRSGPLVMKRVDYRRDPEAVSSWLSARRKERRPGHSAIALALSGKVLPPATETVRIAERIREVLMRVFDDHGVPIPPLLHGKGKDGLPLRDHSHLFILPQANRAGRIDRILLFTRGSEFEPDEWRAVRTFAQRPIWFAGEPLKVVATYAGLHDDYRFRPLTSIVQSRTPFVTPRHWRKGRGTEEEFMHAEVRRECRNHGLPEPEVREGRLPRPFAAGEFRRNRKDDPPRRGYAFRLTFPEPVPAPFSLGYGCHFGLGQFDAVDGA